MAVPAFTPEKIEEINQQISKYIGALVTANDRDALTKFKADFRGFQEQFAKYNTGKVPVELQNTVILGEHLLSQSYLKDDGKAAITSIVEKIKADGAAVDYTQFQPLLAQIDGKITAGLNPAVEKAPEPTVVTKPPAPSAAQQVIDLINAQKTSEALELISKTPVAELNRSGNYQYSSRMGTSTVFNAAMLSGDRQITDALYKKGVDINQTDAAGYSPLAYAAFNGRADDIKYLSERGVDVNQTSKSGQTMQQVADSNTAGAAAKPENFAAVKAALENARQGQELLEQIRISADPTKTENDRKIAEEKVADIIDNKRADLNQSYYYAGAKPGDAKSYTPAGLATRLNAQVALDKTLANGAKANEADINGRAPLDYATSAAAVTSLTANNAEVSSELLEKRKAEAATAETAGSPDAAQKKELATALSEQFDKQAAAKLEAEKAAEKARLAEAKAKEAKGRPGTEKGEKREVPVSRAVPVDKGRIAAGDRGPLVENLRSDLHSLGVKTGRPGTEFTIKEFEAVQERFPNAVVREGKGERINAGLIDRAANLTNSAVAINQSADRVINRAERVLDHGGSRQQIDEATRQVTEARQSVQKINQELTKVSSELGVDVAEKRQAAQRLFKKVDGNGLINISDGVVTKREIETFAKSPEQQRQILAQLKDAGFNVADRSPREQRRTEVEDTRTASATKSGTIKIPKGLLADIKAADANHDGAVDRKELKNAPDLAEKLKNAGMSSGAGVRYANAPMVKDNNHQAKQQRT